jgi:hypothetical protein
MNQLARVLLVALLTLSLTSTAHARECEGVTLPNQVTVDGTPLRLVGLGVREATVLNVDVYVAGLYLDASDSREAMETNFKANGGSAPAFRERLAQLLPMIPAMRVGGHLIFTYLPGTGLQVHVGNRLKGTIAGEDFARVFFAIWFGPNPPNAGLKTGLLGGECG